MIIEIKDLPKDRNVKKITFDIEFEDNCIKNTESTESSKISQDYTKREIKEVQEVQEIPKVLETPKIENSIVPPSIDISKREPKVDEDIMSLEF